MIPQITEINFPSYATLNSATITLSEMGDRNITTQIKIDGDIVPDFSGWELEFKGERFILPVKEPQAAKDNTSRRSIVDLTFSSWAVQEMKRYFFVEMTSIESGTAIADKYKASLGLNIENFVTAFNNVLNYYFNGNIEMDLFGSGTGIYSAEPAFFEIDYTHIWDVLQKIYEIYQVRWTITYDSSTEKYVIKVGYPAAEIDDHEFEYGYEGGLLRFERQVQDYDITNVLLGRGGEKNLPYRYFKKVDPQNPNWAGDPDAIPELKNIYFENLRDINFRRYVQGWKTNPNRILEEGDVVETYDSARGETDFAYAKGHTDERFNPVEYVKDDASIAIYGERWGALENADDIYPTIQGIEVDPYGRIDQVVDVEPVTTDDIEAMAADAAEVTNVAGASRTEWINYNSTLELDINGADFSVPEGKVGNLTIQNTWFDTILYAKRGNDQVNVDPADAVHELVAINTTLSYVTVVNRNTGTELPPAGIPAGNYFYKLHIVVKAEFESSMYNSVNVTVGVNGMKLTTSEGSANAWKPTFDIWIKNIWDTTQQSGESDEQYAARVWEPILGDRTGEEAKVAFSTGFLSISEDYNFTIASIPVVDRTKTIDGVASEWRITLIKSDAEYEATGKYIPNAETSGNASAGDYFFFTGIDMPWAYVLWAEEKLNAYKTAELAKLRQINPTWIIRIDKVRANTKEQGELEYLADRFASGAKLRVKDKRFTNGQVLTLYVQTVTYTWQEPSNGNPYLVPDIEVVLSDKVETVASPIDQLEGSVDLIQSTYAKISDIESAIRRVASPIFLKKTGESERSLSPTRFSSLMASESFRQGDIGGQGWGAYTDGEGHSVLEADTIVVRKDMRVNTLTVNQIAYLGGKQIISAAAMECTKVDDTDSGYVCYFDQKQGSVANLFKVDDIVLGQVWNADESEQRYYKRKVIAVSTDSITLSKDIADGDGVPQPKDIMVQYGSYSDTSRQYVIVRDVIGGGYERMLSGLTTVYANGNEYYFAGRQSGSTPRWFVGDANGQHASYQNGVLNITGRLSVTTQVDKGNGTYESLSNYLSSLQDQIDGNIQTWYATGEPTLQNYPASTWPTVEDKNNHIGDLYYESETGKAYRFMLDGNTYKWVQIADEDIAAALALAQQNQTAIAGLAYLKAATNQGTLVQGGLVLTSMIQLGQTEEGTYKVYSGINGIMDTTALGNGIAAWYGGPMADIGADSTLTDFAKSLFRFDGSGYLASGNIKWDLNGNGEIPGISWNNGRITLSPDIYLQGGDRLTQIVDAVIRMYTQFAYDSYDNITVAPTHALYIPTTSPEYPIAGKVALYYDYNGNYSEIPSGGGGGDVYDLIYKKNGTTITTINLGTAEGIINVTVGWNDLTPDENHRFLTDTLINTWNGKQNAISDLATIRSNASTAATAVDVQQGSCLAVVNGHLTVDTQELDSEMGFGAAAYKGVATSVASGNTNLVTSGAVYTAIQNASPDLSGYLPLTAGSGKALTGNLYLQTGSDGGIIQKTSNSLTRNTLLMTSTGTHLYLGEKGYTQTIFRGETLIFMANDQKNIYFNKNGYFYADNNTVNLGSSANKWTSVYATTLYGNLDWSYIQNKPTLDSIADGSTRKLANYLPLTGGTMTGNITFNSSSDKSIYANNGTLNQRALLMSSSGNLSIGYDLPTNSKTLYLDGYSIYLRYGTTKENSILMNGSNGTISGLKNMVSAITETYNLGNTGNRWLGVYANTVNAATGFTTAGTLSVTGVSTFTGNLVPNTTNATDIGSSSKKFKNLYLAGTATVNGITSSGNILPSSTGLTLGSSSNKWAILWTDEVETDDLGVNGAVLTSLIPDGALDLGSSSTRWGSLFALQADVSNALAIPTATPANPTSGKIYLYSQIDGNYSADAPDAVGISSIVQTTTSNESGGRNIVTVTLSNGEQSAFQVRNGQQGNSGYTGAAGELEVVNNLTDGGATAALSAEMGKTLEENTKKIKYTQIDLTLWKLRVINFYIILSTGVWNNSSNTTTFYVPIVPGASYKIVSQSGLDARYAILKSSATRELLNTTANFATGETALHQFTGTDYFTAPADGYYLAVNLKLSGTDVTPEVYKMDTEESWKERVEYLHWQTTKRLDLRTSSSYFGTPADATNADWGVSQAIWVKGAKMMELYVNQLSTSSNYYGWTGSVFYDENLNPIVASAKLLLRGTAAGSGWVRMAVPDNAAYFRYTVSSGIAAADYPIYLYSQDEDDVYGEAVSQALPYTYFGEAIKIQRRKFNYVIWANMDDTEVQSAAAYGKYLFLVWKNMAKVQLMDLETRQVLYTNSAPGITADTNFWHCNQACFGNLRVDADDTFPVLYVSQQNDSDGRGLVIACRIVPTFTDGEISSFTISVAQNIHLPVMTDTNCLGNPNWTYDEDNDCIWVYSRNNNSAADNYRQVRFTRFAVPALGSDVTLEDSDIVDAFSGDFSALNAQGGVINGGRLFIGQGGGTYGYTWLRVIDLYAQRRQVTFIDLLNTTGITDEPEGMFFYDGAIFICTYQRRIYKLLI